MHSWKDPGCALGARAAGLPALEKAMLAAIALGPSGRAAIIEVKFINLFPSAPRLDVA
ncbi:MAG: hypothetical protein L0219_17815 [Phycisphaerales bacterium]|nr:hypothetical protein [Phycisphaerales bacterium]